MKPEVLRRSVERLKSIPSPSFSLDRILALAGDSESNIAQLAENIESDPVVTARVLRLANSAYFGVSGDVDSVRRAIVVVGYKNVLSLATCAALAPSFEGEDSVFDRNALWVHSCAVGEASRIAANHLGVDPATAYVTGLLHDLGSVVLSEVLGAKYGAVLNEARDRGAPLATVEAELLGGVDHSMAAGYLLSQWKLPENLVAAVVQHHEPPRDLSRLGATVALADALAARAGFLGVTAFEPTTGSPRDLLDALEMEDADFEKLGEELEERRSAVEVVAGAGAS